MPQPSRHPDDHQHLAGDSHGTAAWARGRGHALIDWWFRDRRTGRLVFVQLPNVPLLLWISTLLARRFVETGSGAWTLLGWAGSLLLGWWAIDELVRGVNPSRRLLGLTVLVVVTVGVLDRLT